MADECGDVVYLDRVGNGAQPPYRRLQEERLVVVATLVAEPALVHLAVPAPVPLRRPKLCETFEDALVGHLDGLALDQDIEPSLPLVATRPWPAPSSVSILAPLA
jgi:hypothetical protein